MGVVRTTAGRQAAAARGQRAVHVVLWRSCAVGGMVAWWPSYAPFAGAVVRLALTAATELHLEALEVRLVLDDLDERHLGRRARGGERAGDGAGYRERVGRRES